MRRALELARGVWGTTHPNPMVGAVVVEDGVIVAEGATAPDGGPHAEKAALAALGRPPRPGATLYVTLEPCCTEGRTGACTDSIVAAGLRKVVVGATDPNPAHAGRGFTVLRERGVLERLDGSCRTPIAALGVIKTYGRLRLDALVVIGGNGSLTVAARLHADLGLPVVGVPLPFISYGGTAMVTLGFGIGILLSIAKAKQLVQS